jgi:hypothetical protein
MDETQKLKRRKLMRYWVFGTDIITFAAVTVYTGLWLGTYAIQADWPIYLATIVASAAVLLYYELVYLPKQ